MSAKTIMENDLFKKCLEFHGHLCPGLSMGYQAAMLAMEWLSEKRAKDEEIVAIVETDACCSDAIQVISGCTFGKGNFIYRDYGKIAFTFFSRKNGKGVRISAKPREKDLVSDRHAELLEKIRNNKAGKEEKSEFKKLHRERSLNILDTSPETLFHVREISVPMPPRAIIAPSILCDKCGEPTMASKLVKLKEKSLCGGCMENTGAIN